MKRLALGIVAVSLAAAAGGALAGGRHHHHGGHLSLGFSFGVPLPYSSWYYAPPPVYYYPAPVVVRPAEPPVYVERSDTVPEGSASWFFCKESNSYYPYVRECPGGWQRVPAQPSR